MRKDTKAAFRWIVKVLDNLNINFQIIGGLAARTYGSNREFADIDIVIAEDDFTKVYSKVKDFVVFGPEQYKDPQWDIYLMTLRYENQEIDIQGSTTTKISDKTENIWIPWKFDITENKTCLVYGIMVPVIKKEKLITYKKKIAREVDMEDVKSLESAVQ